MADTEGLYNVDDVIAQHIAALHCCLLLLR